MLATFLCKGSRFWTNVVKNVAWKNGVKSNLIRGNVIRIREIVTYVIWKIVDITNVVRAIVIMANVAKRNFIRTNVVGTFVCTLVKIIIVVGRNAFTPNVIRAN